MANRILILKTFLSVHMFAMALANEDISISVKRASRNAGFHRNVITKVIVSKHETVKADAEREKECSLLLIESLPSGIYVDVHQIAMQVEFGGPEVSTYDSIDIEKPEYLSPPHAIFVYSKLRLENDGFYRATVIIPIHLRYHKPSDDSIEFAEVSLAHPQILIYCQGFDLNKDLQTELPCSVNSKQKCHWLNVTSDVTIDQEPLVFHVPIGQAYDALLVATVTLFTTIGATIYLIYRTLESNIGIDMAIKKTN